MPTTRHHLTHDERQTLLAIVSECGAAEVLRCVAGIVGNQWADVTGDQLKSEIMRVANRLPDAHWPMSDRRL